MRTVTSVIIFWIISCSFTFAQSEYILSVLKHREEVHTEFSDSLETPLEPGDWSHFSGLSYFDVDSSYKVKVRFSVLKKQKKFLMRTTTDRMPEYKKYGTIQFSLGEKDYTLYVYQNIELSKKPGYEDYLFIPFTDLTNGDQTYGGGRYIDFRMPRKEEVWVDFNLAYNPYCSYNAKYSCPIPPAENFLNTEVKAGEKKFSGH